MSTFNASLVVDLFALLRTLEMELPLRGKDGQAVKVIHSLMTLYQAANEQPEADRAASLMGLAQTICPLGANGVGDSIIWRGLRKAQLDTLTNQFTHLTNQVRAELRRVAEEGASDLATIRRKAEVVSLKETFQGLYPEVFDTDFQFALDELVEDQASSQSSSLNNQGVEIQIDFLLAQGFSSEQLQSAIANKL